MSRSLVAFVAVLICSALSPGGEPSSLPSRSLPRTTLENQTPTQITAWLKQQTGTEIDVTAIGDRKVTVIVAGEFWAVLEQIAQLTECRISTVGSKIALKPGKSHSPSFVKGPFRFVAREVTARIDLETRTTSYAVILDVAWEPWLNAYRIDGVPKIAKAVDDRGIELTFGQTGARTFTSGNVSTLIVNPKGISRASKSISLAGSVGLTIADELLTFTMPIGSCRNGSS